MYFSATPSEPEETIDALSQMRDEGEQPIEVQKAKKTGVMLSYMII